MRYTVLTEEDMTNRGISKREVVREGVMTVVAREAYDTVKIGAEFDFDKYDKYGAVVNFIVDELIKEDIVVFENNFGVSFALSSEPTTYYAISKERWNRIKKLMKAATNHSMSVVRGIEAGKETYTLKAEILGDTYKVNFSQEANKLEKRTVANILAANLIGEISIERLLTLTEMGYTKEFLMDKIEEKMSLYR